MKKPRVKEARYDLFDFDLDEAADLSPEGIEAAHVVRFGPRCAAWLVNCFRRRLRRTGAFFLYIPSGAELPPWFRIARDYLRDHRTKKWEFEELVVGSVRRFTFHWKGSHRLPSSITPVGRC